VAISIAKTETYVPSTFTPKYRKGRTVRQMRRDGSRTWLGSSRTTGRCGRASLTFGQEALAERYRSCTAPQANDLLSRNRTTSKVGSHVRKAAGCYPSFAIVQ
jgi:hypothetical protein